MLATILIIAGFVLNALQAYVADFSSRFAKRVQSCADRLGLIEMDYGLPYPDYDPDIPDDQRDTVASRNTVFRFWHLAVLAWHFKHIEFGDGALWLALELLVWFISGWLIAVLMHMLFVIIFNLCMVILSDGLGQGDLVAGLGVLIGCIGLVLHSIELFQQKAWGALFIMWVTVAIFVYWLRRRSILQGLDKD